MCGRRCVTLSIGWLQVAYAFRPQRQELGCEEIAGPQQGDRPVGNNAGRLCGQDQDAVAEEDGFLQIMGDKDHGPPAVPPDVQHFALHALARVVSRPEPELALLDAGKRDLPSDLDLPVVLDVPGATVTSLADQHCFVRLPPDAELAVGDVVQLGISHPCTAFQLWRLLPEVDGDRVVGFVETNF